MNLNRSQLFRSLEVQPIDHDCVSSSNQKTEELREMCHKVAVLWEYELGS